MINLSFTEFCDQGLIQKQKVDINGENGTQINIAAINNVTQGLAQILIMESKQAVSYISFSFFCYYLHIMLLIRPKNWL